MIFVLLMSGCGAPEAETPTIRVAAASDLETALPILAAAFKQDHGIDVIPIFGASGDLTRQIRQGAPFDVFLSADRSFIDELDSSGQVRRDSIQPYARGSLVLAVNKLSAIKIETMADLKKSEVHKIAIANPDRAPYGRAAKQALERANLWNDLKPKIVMAESVRQALQMVQTGNAEVAFVGRAIADVREAVTVPLPADAYDPIIQYLAIVSETERPDDSKAFVNFILSEPGQGILFQMGFRGVKTLKSADSKPAESAKVTDRP